MFDLNSPATFSLACCSNNNHLLHNQNSLLKSIDNYVRLSGPPVNHRYEGYNGASCFAFVGCTISPPRRLDHPRQKQRWHNPPHLVQNDDPFIDAWDRRFAPLRGSRYNQATLTQSPSSMKRVVAVVNSNQDRGRQQQQQGLYQSRRNDQDDGRNYDDRTIRSNNSVEQWIDQLVGGSTFTTKSSMILYPTLIAISSLVLPWSTSVLFLFLYFGYSYLGRSVISMDDDDDDVDDECSNNRGYDPNMVGDRDGDEPDGSSPPAAAVNFAAFVAALLSAGILTPLSTTSPSSTSNSVIVERTNLIVAPSSDTISYIVPSNLLILVVGGIAFSIATAFFLQPKQEGNILKSNSKVVANSIDAGRKEIHDETYKQVDPSTVNAEKRMMELWDEQLRNVAPSAVNDDDDR
jgi:hypothetical protein